MNLEKVPSALRAAARWPGLLAVLSLVALGGCASVYRVDNAVESFPRWNDVAGGTRLPAAAPKGPQTYRFDRLPSQVEGRHAAGQDQLEQLARTALGKVGWHPGETGAPTAWTVQVSAHSLRLPHAPWDDPWDRRRGGFGLLGRDHIITGSGQIIWTPMFMPMDWPYYQRKVSLLIRHSDRRQVVYETHAAHEGRWHSTPELWSAMLDAALNGFPTPLAGMRQVHIDVPR